MSDPTVPTNPPPPTCPRHPDRITYLRCQRCERPACPQCQHPAPVGFHCIDCVLHGQAAFPRERGLLGGTPAPGPPRTTYALIAICVVVFVGQLLSPEVTRTLAFAPVLGEAEPWRMLTAAFLHDPNHITHILFNMVALWTMGQFLEPVLGRVRFILLYLISALGGSVGYLLLSSPPSSMTGLQEASTWMTFTLGASGAVFGLFAAVLILLRHFRQRAGGMVVLLLINLALPIFVPQIAWQAHLAGFVTGAACVAALLATRTRERERFQLPLLGAIFAVLVALTLAKYGMVDTSLLWIGY